MAKGMKLIALFSTFFFIGLLVWYLIVPNSVLLSFTITLGVIAYHFLMRLLVGTIIDAIFKNNLNYNGFWFKPRKFEKKLYKLLRVRRWTKNIPTYSPETFDIKKHSWEEIAKATAQAEIVHEIIILLSFLPILLIIPFGTPLVFILTSVVSALFDSIFVIAQRYNRPKIVAYLNKLKKKAE
ncbi:MAG: hypothetical protein IJ400_00345 [Clostridia bacterium]|nr:hypothetical protein [Clostridia bacterium]